MYNIGTLKGRNLFTLLYINDILNYIRVVFGGRYYDEYLEMDYDYS